MAFVASQGPGCNVTIATGGGTVTVPVPAVMDVAGNGYSGNLCTHYFYGGVAVAINPALNSVTVQQNATSAQILQFGSSDGN